MDILKAIFGTKAQRDVKRLRPMVEKINALETQYQAISEDELKAKTPEFRERLAKGETLDDILPEAFAVVKNACRRLCGTKREVCGHELVWDMIPFDVQLIGGIVLHQGKIAEMQTGEGKTLVATMPLYLNALAGKNVQLVTVNDYLARRDSQWMGLVYEYLGLTVGCIQNSMSWEERRAQYSCDITYGTNSEFGFDYLRDNGMAFDRRQLVQNGHHYAIIDEVDSILIDEARTPLIISGPAEHSSHQFDSLKPQIERLVRKQRDLCNDIARDVKEAYDAGNRDAAMAGLYKLYHGMPKHKQFLHLIEDPAVRKMHEDVESMMLTEMRKDYARSLMEKLLFTIDEKSREVALTDRGCEELNPNDPEMFVIPDLATAMSALEGDKSLSGPERAEKRRTLQAEFTARSERVQNCDQLLRAYCLYERDVDYVVQDNHVLIVDEFTGRILPGRRWNEGLHQAVEAKEGVQIERETQTLATITIQNYFRLYKKLAGMTGTAETEASEFKEIYKLDVVPIPTNRPVRRIDQNDLIYKTQREKYAAIVREVAECHAKNQPVLLGTVNVDTSEVLSRLLRLAHIQHNVLNAKNHAKEAEIVARAGQPGAVTIATNMAGRGTDIKLGPGVVWVPEYVVKSQATLDDLMPKKVAELQATGDTPVAEDAGKPQATGDTPAAEDAAKSQATGDTPAAEDAAKAQATGDIPVTEDAAKAQTTSDTPVAEDAGKAQATGDTPVAEDAAKAQATGDTPAAEDAGKPQAAGDTPVAEDAAKAQATSDTPVAEDAAKAQATGDTPAAEDAGKPQAAGDTPVAEDAGKPQAAGDTPVAEDAAKAQATSDTPVAEDAAKAQAAGDTPAAEDAGKQQAAPDTHTYVPKTLGQLLRERPCGLYVIGSERHESRRIDRQLRGRCARQGDPGMSRFYISFEDSLMRLFASERMANVMSRFGLKDGVAIEHPWLNRTVERAQRRVEEQNFSIRKRTLEFDDVMNRQREVIYAFRNEIILAEPEALRERILDVVNDLAMTQAERFMSNAKDSDPAELADWAQATFPVAISAEELSKFAGNPEGAGEAIFKSVETAYANKCSGENPELLPIVERSVVLLAIDTQWQEFLRAMDELRHGVGLRAYGQRDPLVEYKREAFGMFEELMGTIKAEIAQSIFKFTTSGDQYRQMMHRAGDPRRVAFHPSFAGPLSGGAPARGGMPPQGAAGNSYERAIPRAVTPPAPQYAHVGRNDKCPCGSGKKYKHCCGDPKKQA